MKSLRCCAPLLALVCLSASLLAKGSTTRIVVSASDLAAPLEITDADVLQDFVVWAGPGAGASGDTQHGGFIIDWSAGIASTRPAGLPRYEVSFYVAREDREAAGQPERLAYAVSYELDPGTGRGYVFLPGRGDERYALNTRTILRGREGHWFHASEAWNRAVATLIDGRR